METSAPVQSPKPKASPKDVFLHLLMIAMLYASAISLIALLWQYINRFFPDPLAYDNIADTIRISLSTLVIVFPVFFWVVRHLENDLALAPEKRALAIRRWLLNLTLFIAGITIIVDLVRLVYEFLGGGLTPRFTLKVLAVGLVALAIFAYYIWDLRRKTAEFLPKMRNLARACVAVIAVIAVGGFFIAGSPFAERSRKFDNQRIGDLQNVQYQIITYWQQKGVLPQSLNDLRNDISGYAAPLDPETHSPYSYSVKSGLSFELCAVFNADSSAEAKSAYPRAVPVGPYGNGASDNWSHGAGQTCFTRTIDPELYKLYPKTEKIPPPLL